MITPKTTKYIIAIIIVTASFLAGYLLMPTKTITEKVEVVKYVKINQVLHSVQKPDGTITTDIVTNTNSVEQSNSETKTEINKKYNSAELGMLINKDMYLHVTTDIKGPFFIGVHITHNYWEERYSIGGGLGFRF